MAYGPVIYTVLIKKEIERDENISISEWQKIVEEVRDEAERLIPLQVQKRVLEARLGSINREINHER